MEDSGKIHTMEPVTKMCGAGEAVLLRELMTKVGDKWTVLVVAILARFPDETARFSELQRTINGISQRMLTTTLRNLERDGFITRKVFAVVPPKVEYRLTELGSGLLEPTLHLLAWIDANWESVKQARNNYDRILSDR